jgi:hypothetical protein
MDHSPPPGSASGQCLQTKATREVCLQKQPLRRAIAHLSLVQTTMEVAFHIADSEMTRHTASAGPAGLSPVDGDSFIPGVAMGPGPVGFTMNGCHKKSFGQFPAGD